MNMMSEPHLPTSANASHTLADGRRYLENHKGLSVPFRRDQLSGLSGIERICGMPAAGIELTCPNLRELLYCKPAAAFGFTPQRFGKLVGALRLSMRGLGLHAPKPSRERLSPAWRRFYDALPGLDDETPGYRQVALSGLIGFCSDAGVDADHVPAEILSLFEDHLKNRTLEPDPAGLARRTASNWNWARGHVPEWSALPELRRPRMRDFYTVPFTRYPASFQDDVRRYADGLARKNHDEIYHDGVQVPSGKRYRRVARPRTVETRLNQLRQAAAALVINGIPIESLQTCRDLVVPFERASMIRRFYLNRHGDEPNSQVAGILETVRQIACHHCRLPADQVAVIAGWVSEARPDWTAGMTEKNRRRLRALIQLRPRAMLLHFPSELLKRAQTKGLTPKAAARLVAYAVALEIELVFPMRRQNLAGLRLNEHLQRLGPRGRRVTHIFLSGSEMKNRQGMEWELPRETCDLIETYLRDYRPHLAEPGNMFLFPGPGTKGRSAHELALGLCGLIGRELGIELNIHLLRHFGGWLYLQRHPGNYEILRQALGHKKIEVTKACYTGLEADAAARHFDASVLADRAETRHIAQASFRKPGGKAARRRTHE